MFSKSYFSYIRVSTQRQGQLGTSLAEQQAAIEQYAGRFGLRISRQYEERETAAKQGRPVFLDMLKALKKGKAGGLIMHKIDRSARNLKDWSELISLIDKGVEVHFANESLDLNSRGGRLSADIQAVVASDYIRNLREETKKGIHGRLKQGLYPFPARVGYLNAGKGNVKEIDPAQAPLVKQAFEFYASGAYGLNALVEKMYEMGLRNKNGGKISRNGLVCILKNPFYMGVIRIDTIGELFIGKHEPIVSKMLFDQVQNVFAGKCVRKKIKHFFLFRRLINCERCGRFLIAEKQKGLTYYRCQTKKCPQKTIREETINEKLLSVLKKLRLDENEFSLLKKEAEKYLAQEVKQVKDDRNQLLMEASSVENRISKLADAYTDDVFDKETYLTKKNELILKRQEIREKLEYEAEDHAEMKTRFNEFLELLKTAYLSYELGNQYEKRDLAQIVTSNCTVADKTVAIKLKKPFQTVLERKRVPIGSPTLATHRTVSALLSQLLKFFRESGESHMIKNNAAITN